MLGAIAKVFAGTPAAVALGVFKKLAIDPTRSLRTYLSQGLHHTLSSIEGWEEPASAIGQGTTNVAAAATQFTATSTPCIRVYVTARPGNAGSVWVGGATIAGINQGVEMVAGAGPIPFDIDDVSKLWAWAANAGDDLDWTYVARP